MVLANNVYCGDCLELMKEIDDQSVDLILCDLPYGTTRCKWDVIIPFESLWQHYSRIIKPNGAILLFGNEPFSSKLRLSNINQYKYDWYWQKDKAANFLFGNKMPLKNKETKMDNTQNYHGKSYEPDKLLPKQLIYFAREQRGKAHPTQKPVALCEYLIKTYTNEGDLVLDNCLGSGTTAIACIRTGRNYIGIEKEQKYVDIALQRIAEEKSNA